MLRNQDNLLLKTQYNTFKNKVTNMIQRGKRKHFQQKIRRNQDDPRQLWNVVEELVAKGSNYTNIGLILTENGEHLTGDKAISNEFNT